MENMFQIQKKTYKTVKSELQRYSTELSQTHKSTFNANFDLKNVTQGLFLNQYTNLNQIDFISEIKEEKGIVTGIKIKKPQIKNSEQLLQNNIYLDSSGISEVPNQTSNNLNWSIWKKNESFFGGYQTDNFNKISTLILPEDQDNQNSFNPIYSISQKIEIQNHRISERHSEESQCEKHSKSISELSAIPVVQQTSVDFSSNEIVNVYDNEKVEIRPETLQLYLNQQYKRCNKSYKVNLDEFAQSHNLTLKSPQKNRQTFYKIPTKPLDTNEEKQMEDIDIQLNSHMMEKVLNQTLNHQAISTKEQRDFEQDLRLNRRRLLNKEIDIFWQREFMKQLQKYNVGSIDDEKKRKFMKKNELFKHLNRFQRLYGLIVDKQLMKKHLNDPDIRQKFAWNLEEQFDQTVNQNLDNFLNMDFQEYCRFIEFQQGIGETEDKEQNWNIKVEKMFIENINGPEGSDTVFYKNNDLNELPYRKLSRFAARFVYLQQLIGKSPDDVLESLKFQLENVQPPSQGKPEMVIIQNIKDKLQLNDDKEIVNILIECIQQDKNNYRFKYQQQTDRQSQDNYLSLQELTQKTAQQIQAIRKTSGGVSIFDEKNIEGQIGLVTDTSEKSLSFTNISKRKSLRQKFPNITENGLQNLKGVGDQLSTFIRQEGLQQITKQKFRGLVNEFVSKIEEEQNHLNIDSKLSERRDEDLRNPSQALDIDDLIETNLELALVSKKVYSHIQNGLTKQKQLNSVKDNAQIIMQSLKEKSIEKQKKDLQKLKAMKIMNQFMLDKRDALVLKFIINLKQKLQDQKDQRVQQENEKIVEEILKRINFQKESKTFNVNRDVNFDFFQIQNETEQIDQLASFAQEQVNYFNKVQKQKTGINTFLNKAMEMQGTPLPILNKITETKELFLFNYHLDEINSTSLGQSLRDIVPQQLKHIYFYENSMNDKSLAQLISGLINKDQSKQGTGLSTLFFQKNKFGEEFFDSLIQYVKSDNINQLEELVLKENHPDQNKLLHLNNLFHKMVESQTRLTKLRKLTLSYIGIDSSSLDGLAECTNSLANLQALDISCNRLNISGINSYLKKTLRKSNLKYLNLSFNSAGQTKGNLAKNKFGSKNEVSEFYETLSNYIHYSDSLIEIDLSCMSFDEHGVKYLFQKGLSKSRSVLICHLRGLLIAKKSLSELLKILNCKDNQNQLMMHKKKHVQFFEKDSKMIFKNLQEKQIIQSQSQLLSTQLKKKRDAQHNQLVNIQNQIPIDLPEDQQLVLQRILGHPEILESNFWCQMNPKQSLFQRQPVYCLLIWNRQLQLNDKGLQFYQHNLSNDCLKTKKVVQNPVAYINDKSVPMVPIIEFFERLKAGEQMSKVQARPCNNEEEIKLKSTLVARLGSIIGPQLSKINYSYWEASQDIFRPERKQLRQDIKKFDFQNLYRELNFSLPQNSFQPIVISDYLKHILEVYQDQQQKEKDDLEEAQRQEIAAMRKQMSGQSLNQVAKAQEVIYEKYRNLQKSDQKLNDDIIKLTSSNTYMAALLCDLGQIGHREVQLCIKDPETKGVFYRHRQEELGHNDFENTKQITLKDYPLKYKQIKKMFQVRRFQKQTSIFKDFPDVTPQNIAAAYEADKMFMKTKKFIKNQSDLIAVDKYLKQNYIELFEQFNLLIAKEPGLFPSIGMTCFQTQCRHIWKILDPKNCTPADIDLAFVNTNYEEVDLESNDDKSLCRYEFLEILVRIAQTKFIKNGNQNLTFEEACKSLIEEFILKTNMKQLTWQQWRQDKLWTIEIDDLLKANKQAIDQIYKQFQARDQVGDLKGIFSRQKLFSMMTQLGFTGTEFERKILIAFSQSKHFMLNEMEESEAYNQIKLSEFYEFICRAAYYIMCNEDLSFEENERQISLLKKVEKLISQLIKTFTPEMEIEFPNIENQAESESDYEDDIVIDILDQYFH